MLQSPLIAAFERQVGWCREPSPFTAQLLDRSRLWLLGDSQAHDTVAATAADPMAAATALRWAGALHHLALRGLQPWAGLWPPQPGASDAALDAAIRQAWQEQRPALLAALAHPPQTNEVQRSAVLLPGLLCIAARTGLPLALHEIGASAGLNLWPERHRYDYGRWTWGAPTAPLALACDWRGPVPAEAAATLRVASRAACDAQPVDLASPGEALRLTSFVWPDQADRLQRLRTALAAVPAWMQDEHVSVRPHSAADFVEGLLQAPRPGVATVLMHSIVWQYLPAAEQQRIAAAMAAAGAVATPQAPLAWLRLEPPQADLRFELRCRVWPGGDDEVLATAHPHGAWVDWQGGAA